MVLSAPPSIGAVAAAHPEPGDVDGDLIKNEVDNCPTTPNGAQVNTDGDAEGDACDADDDNDGVLDDADNCRLVPNPGQEDTNPPGGRGDACPAADSDGDGRFDDEDNCVSVANADQADLDGDDMGDACDRDDDNDLFNDPVDNCPSVYNPTTSTAPPYVQADLDGDGIGSACDPEELIAGPATVPGATPGGAVGSVPGATTSKDTSAPGVTVTVQRRVRLADSGASLVIKTSCSEACDLNAALAADAKSARRARLGSKRVVLATGAWSLAGAGRTYVFARFKPAARKLRAGRKLVATLRLTAKDAAGNARTVTKRIELRK